MTYSCLWRRILFHKQIEFFPTHRSTLASPINPFEKYMNCLIAKCTDPFRIEGYSVILNMPCQLNTKAFPNILEFILVSYFAAPIIHSLKFRSVTFSDCFYFRNHLTGLTAAKIESESQEIERSLLVAFPSFEPRERYKPSLFFVRL